MELITMIVNSNDDNERKLSMIESVLDAIDIAEKTIYVPHETGPKLNEPNPYVPYNPYPWQLPHVWYGTAGRADEMYSRDTTDNVKY